MGLLLLTLTISGLALHGWFATLTYILIEIELNLFAFNLVVFSGAVLNGIVFMKLDRIVNPVKDTFFNKSKYFHLYYINFLHQIFMNVFNIINISKIIINTKIIDISIKPSFFILSTDQTFEINIMDLLQFQNLLLWIYKFLYHWQTSNYLLHCNVNLNRISFL